MVSRNGVQTIEVPISGMCCAEEAQQVQRAVASIPGVETVEILLSSEKAVIKLNNRQVNLSDIQKAVESAGCSVPQQAQESTVVSPVANQRRRIIALLGIVFGLVLFVVVVGEWLGLLEAVTERLPWPVWLLLVLVAGYPIFHNVLRAALRRQVISHTLMSLGRMEPPMVLTNRLTRSTISVAMIRHAPRRITLPPLLFQL